MEIPLFSCRISTRNVQELFNILESGQLATGGYVYHLESAISKLVGNREVVLMDNVTHAIEMACRLCGATEGSEIITTSFNCMASNSALLSVNAKVIWADVSPREARIDIKSLISRITPLTKAVIAYHIAGYPYNAVEIQSICQERGLSFIEDANCALGASLSGKAIGTFGDFSVLSLYCNRQINAIEGAALICNDPEKALLARKLRRFAIDPHLFRDASGEIRSDYDIGEYGMNASMTNLNAFFGLSSLMSFEKRRRHSKSNAYYIRSRLPDTALFSLVPWSEVSQPSFWVLLAQSSNRDKIQHNLRQAGVQTTRLHHPNHLYSCFSGHGHGLEGTRRLYQDTFAIPCGWWLTKHDLDLIVKAIEPFI
jgi:perosamine synthetase